MFISAEVLLISFGLIDERAYCEDIHWSFNTVRSGITASDEADSEVGRLSLAGEKYKKPLVEAGVQTFQ